MFEIIKFFVEQAMKVINIKELVQVRNKGKLASLGVEMFDLYSSLNRILVCGLQIVDEIEDMTAYAERVNRKGEGMRGSYLASLLNQQAENIVDFSHSFVGLAKKLDVLDPDATRQMTYFLSTKFNFIRLLLRMLEPTRRDEVQSFAVETDGVLIEALEKVQYEREINDYSSGLNDAKVQQRMTKAVFGAKSVSLTNKVPFKKAELLERYLKERQPRKQLDELKSILRDLHKVLASNFKVEDVLMGIGDERAEKRDIYPAHWDLHEVMQADRPNH